jgi:membrane associated rhomboid family serine protease
MLLPLGDSPNPRGTPFVTYGLIAANVAIYLLVTLPLGAERPDPADPAVLDYLRVLAAEQGGPIPAREILARLTAYDLFVFRHGFQPASPSFSDLLFSMFLHGGLMHLFGNMLFLWIYGDNVEHRLGGGRFLFAYLLTGVAATFFHAIFDLDSRIPMVGASGAISGVLGFYFVWFPHNKVRLLIALFPFLVDVITVPARMILMMYLILENVLPFLISRGLGGGGVAYGAHIGGFIAGWAIARWLDRRVEAIPPPEFRHASRETIDPAPARAQEIRQMIENGEFAEAADRYFSIRSEETKGLLAPRDALKFAAWLGVTGHPEAACVVYRRLLRDHPTGPEAAEAHLALGEILLQRLRQPAAAYQHLLDALDLEPGPEIAHRANQLLEEISALQKYRVRGR